MKSKMQKLILISILILIPGIVSISGCINNSDNKKIISGHFENQYIKFNLPAGVTAEDVSKNQTSFDLILYKNGNSIGEINSEVTPPQAINALDGSNTTFAGKKAIESNDEFGSLLYIKFRNDSQGNTIGIRIELDPGFSKDYESIKNSLVIKKNL